MGRAHDPFLLGPVAHFVENIPHGVITAALLPDFRWLKGGHEHFKRAGAVHFFAHDLFDFAQGAQAERKKGIKAARQFAHQARAQKQFVREDFRLRGGFLQGRY